MQVASAPEMSSHVTVDRLQFALTATFHYLFPILTMGLAPNVLSPPASGRS